MIIVTTTYTRQSSADPYFYDVDTVYSPVLMEEIQKPGSPVLSYAATPNQDLTSIEIVTTFSSQETLDAFLATLQTRFDMAEYLAARESHMLALNQTCVRQQQTL